jgi:hypothetical protein
MALLMFAQRFTQSQMRFFGAAVFGAMALATTIAASVWPYFGALILLLALPLWMLFVLYLVRSFK